MRMENMGKNPVSDKVMPLEASAIREIFKMIAKDNIISFAGGIPDPALFPKEALGKSASTRLLEDTKATLVYGITDGYAPLKTFVKDRLKKEGVIKDHDDVIITTGGQQAIDLAAKVLLNEGDTIVVERPSFIGGLNAFRSYGAKMVDVGLDDDGMNMEELESILKVQDVKAVYTIATFQNPAGVTMSVEKRKILISLAEKYDFYIIEDNPYGELRFSGDAVPTVKSFDTNGRVVYCGTFSKTISPGLRVGFAAARAEDILERMVVVKQVNDVHTPLLTQMMVYDFVTQNDFDAHIAKAADLYGKKCHAMVEAIETYFPKDVTFTRPEGGIFLMCHAREGVDAKELLKKVIDKGVAYVPGNTFMVDLDKPSNMFRLNYSTVSIQDIQKGIEILGSALK